jgi:hypothetical protein
VTTRVLAEVTIPVTALEVDAMTAMALVGLAVRVVKKAIRRRDHQVQIDQVQIAWIRGAERTLPPSTSLRTMTLRNLFVLTPANGAVSLCIEVVVLLLNFFDAASPKEKHHGVNPDDWEVDSVYSYRSQNGSLKTRSMYEGSTLQSGNSDSEDVVSEYFSMSIYVIKLNIYIFIMKVIPRSGNTGLNIDLISLSFMQGG